MTSIRRSVTVAVLFIAYGMSLVWAHSLVRNKLWGMIDFQCVYYATSCLIHGQDPYNQDQLYAFYREQKGDIAPRADSHIQIVIQLIYLPTTFLLVAPFAVLYGDGRPCYGPAYRPLFLDWPRT